MIRTLSHRFIKQATLRDTVSYRTAMTWTLLLPVWKAFTSTRNQMYKSDRIHLEIQFSLVQCFIPSSIFYWLRLPLFEQTLIHPTTLICHIWLNTLSKGKTCRRRAEEIACVDQNNKRNESIALQSRSSLYYIWKSRWRKVKGIWKTGASSTLNLHQWFRLRVISHLCLTFRGQVHRWTLNGI